jgi:branched-chain amino acid transport system permease protein
VPIQAVILSTTIVLLFVLHLVIFRTRLGRNIRAVADNPANSARLGINVKLSSQQVFFISSALASAAGLLFAVRIGTANTDIGLAIGLKALAVMAIGGMGDIRGAVVGGLLVGLIETLGVSFGLGRLSDLTVWVLMILVLLIRPQGLFGSRLHGAQIRA